MNGLILRLNIVIDDAIKQVNSQRGTQQVHYIDIDSKFQDQHYWCESGNFHEPEPNRQDTWFFLSGWPDVPWPDALNTTSEAVSLRFSSRFIASDNPPWLGA